MVKTKMQSKAATARRLAGKSVRPRNEVLRIKIPEKWTNFFNAEIQRREIQFPVTRKRSKGNVDPSEPGRVIGNTFSILHDAVNNKESGQYEWPEPAERSDMSPTDAVATLAEQKPTYRGKGASQEVVDAITAFHKIPINKYAFGKCESRMDYDGETLVFKLHHQDTEADGVTPRVEFEHREAKQSRERLLKNITPAGVEGCAHKLAF